MGNSNFGKKFKIELYVDLSQFLNFAKINLVVKILFFCKLFQTESK